MNTKKFLIALLYAVCIAISTGIISLVILTILLKIGGLL